MERIKNAFSQRVNLLQNLKGWSQQELSAICCLSSACSRDTEPGVRNIAPKSSPAAQQALKRNLTLYLT